MSVGDDAVPRLRRDADARRLRRRSVRESTIRRYLARRNGWRPRFRRFPQLPHELGDRRVGRRVELLAQQRFVNARVLQRSGPVSRRRERPHQCSRDARIQQIEGRKPTPPGD